MTIRSIFLFAPAETSSADRGASALAISLAQATGAGITLFCVALDVTTPGRDTDASAVAARIAAAAEAAGVDCLAITDHSHAVGVHEAAAEIGRLHDLVVVGCDGAGLLSERLVAEHLLFDSGRPVLLVPANHSAAFAAGHVVVAWDNTAGAARALGDAVSLLQPAAIDLLTIGDDKDHVTSLATEQVEACLARRGLRAGTVTASLAGRTVAEALQAEAAARGAGILVMGAYAHSSLRRFVLGSATASMLEGCRMPTLLSH